MDPDIALRNLREALEAKMPTTALEAFKSLDDWLKRGGFLPRDWDVPRDRSERLVHLN